jgi:uncharacterized protein (TIGR00730 family)
MNIAVYCGSTSGNREAYTIKAAQLGLWMAEQGHTLVYGGAQGGLMGTVANAVLSNDGKAIGVIPDIDSIQKRKHPGLTEYISTKDMADRKAKMIELADAYVALPGGPGTLDELSDILSLSRLGIDNKPCVLFDIEGYYQPLKKVFEGMIEAGFSGREDFRNVLISEDMAEITAFLERA